MSTSTLTISTDLIGAKLKPFLHKSTFRQTSNYAAAIEDENTIYYNTHQENGVSVHPLFPVAISWQAVEHLDRYLEVYFDGELLHRAVHLSEYLEINAPFTASGDITVTGQIVDLRPHALGSKITMQLVYTNEEGTNLANEYTSALLFGVTCEGDKRGTLPKTEKVDITEPIWEENIAVSRLAPYLYDGCAGIVSKIHTDIKFAQSIGLPDIILHGTATLARAVSLFINEKLGGKPQRVKTIAGKFTGMLVLPNTIRVRLLKETTDELFFDILDSDNNALIKGGYIQFQSL
ncbi:MAG: hypothetical protein GY810_18255 [Aureispira sp.]|nr:hypothetical protein [Aureispira sp.]